VDVNADVSHAVVAEIEEEVPERLNEVEDGAAG